MAAGFSVSLDLPADPAVAITGGGKYIPMARVPCQSVWPTLAVMSRTLDPDTLQARFLASLPENLCLSAMQLYAAMRLEPFLVTVSDDSLADLLCSNTYRSILRLHTASREPA